MKEALQTEDALERLHRVTRNILRRNGIVYSTIRLLSAQSEAVGSTTAAVEIRQKETTSFRICVTVFDSEDELAIRISREVEVLNRRVKPADRHEFIYCWCGHSGDTARTEKGQHYTDVSRGLSCRDCDALGVPPGSRHRARPLACPCCSHGHLPFKSFHDPVTYCERCSGLGYLKPSYYFESR